MTEVILKTGCPNYHLTLFIIFWICLNHFFCAAPQLVLVSLNLTIVTPEQWPGFSLQGDKGRIPPVVKYLLTPAPEKISSVDSTSTKIFTTPFKSHSLPTANNDFHVIARYKLYF